MPLSPAAGLVRSLHRYPVKSLGGETLERVAVDARGLAGDRAWAVQDPDGKLGSGKSTRRFRRMEGLLHLRASLDDEGPVVELPDGRRVRVGRPEADAALSVHVGRSVTLAPEAEVPFFDDGPVHLVTTSTLRALGDGDELDPRRLRPNLVVETAEAGFVEDAWIGRQVAVGPDVVLRVVDPMPRCVMVTMAQRGLAADPGVLRTIAAEHDNAAGVLLEVVRPGEVAAGDEVRLLP